MPRRACSGNQIGNSRNVSGATHCAVRSMYDAISRKLTTRFSASGITDTHRTTSAANELVIFTGQYPFSHSNDIDPTKTDFLKPFGDSTMMGACPSAALAETVSTITALGRCSLRSCRTVLGSLYGFSRCIPVRTVVATFGLRILGLRCRLSGGWLRSLCRQRTDQYGGERNCRR